MTITRIIGLVLLAVGMALVFIGFNATQSVGERVVEGITGRFTNQTLWFLIGGIGACVGGAALTFWGNRGATP
jgi:divalent metal cation (Fe/Co/Zn/Cd) transporter